MRRRATGAPERKSNPRDDAIKHAIENIRPSGRVFVYIPGRSFKLSDPLSKAPSAAMEWSEKTGQDTRRMDVEESMGRRHSLTAGSHLGIVSCKLFALHVAQKTRRVSQLRVPKTHTYTQLTAHESIPPESKSFARAEVPSGGGSNKSYLGDCSKLRGAVSTWLLRSFSGKLLRDDKHGPRETGRGMGWF